VVISFVFPVATIPTLYHNSL